MRNSFRSPRVLVVGPYQLLRLGRQPRLAVVRQPRAREVDYSRLKYILYGASPIPLDLLRECMEVFGCGFCQQYGMTETCGAATGVPANHIKPGSIGPAAEFNEVRLDPVTGEILVRGKNVFAGYLNLPEKTAETIDAEGWLHTGDVGVLDERGYLRITDRLKLWAMTRPDQTFMARRARLADGSLGDWRHITYGQAWQAARTQGDFSLVGCTLAPGFEFAGFALLADEPQVQRDWPLLAAQYPELV